MIGLHFETDEPLIFFAGSSFAAAGFLSLLGSLFVKRRAKAFLEAEKADGRKEADKSEELGNVSGPAEWEERPAVREWAAAKNEREEVVTEENDVEKELKS